MIDAAGSREIRWLLLAGGIIAIHSATAAMTRSSVPPPVTAVMDARRAWLPARMTEVERRLGSASLG